MFNSSASPSKRCWRTTRPYLAKSRSCHLQSLAHFPFPLCRQVQICELCRYGISHQPRNLRTSQPSAASRLMALQPLAGLDCLCWMCLRRLIYERVYALRAAHSDSSELLFFLSNICDLVAKVFFLAEAVGHELRVWVSRHHTCSYL